MHLRCCDVAATVHALIVVLMFRSLLSSSIVVNEIGFHRRLSARMTQLRECSLLSHPAFQVQMVRGAQAALCTA